jgi:hypothetical protein
VPVLALDTFTLDWHSLNKFNESHLVIEQAFEACSSKELPNFAEMSMEMDHSEHP